MTDTMKLERLIRESLKSGEENMNESSSSFNKVYERLQSGETVKNKDRNSGIPFRIRLYDFFANGVYRFATILIICLITTGFAAGTIAKDIMRTDKIDYPFVDDPAIVGKWQSVDFVSNIDDFTPDKQHFAGQHPFKGVIFGQKGGVYDWFSGISTGDFRWTKGFFISEQNITASSYTIKNINGAAYMFLQWKSGDYTIKGEEPYYYVLKKVDDSITLDATPIPKMDKTDYPFEPDPLAIGEWQVVDYVDKISDFTTTETIWKSYFNLRKLEIKKGGKIIPDDHWKACPLTWTKGLILNKRDHLACRYEIKEIDGKTYMFYEWKSGDYVYRGATPKYYVLKKVK